MSNRFLDKQATAPLPHGGAAYYLVGRSIAGLLWEESLAASACTQKGFFVVIINTDAFSSSVGRTDVYKQQVTELILGGSCKRVQHLWYILGIAWSHYNRGLAII